MSEDNSLIATPSPEQPPLPTWRWRCGSCKISQHISTSRCLNCGRRRHYRMAYPHPRDGSHKLTARTGKQLSCKAEIEYDVAGWEKWNWWRIQKRARNFLARCARDVARQGNRWNPDCEKELFEDIIYELSYDRDSRLMLGKVRCERDCDYPGHCRSWRFELSDSSQETSDEDGNHAENAMPIATTAATAITTTAITTATAPHQAPEDVDRPEGSHDEDPASSKDEETIYTWLDGDNNSGGGDKGSDERADSPPLQSVEPTNDDAVGQAGDGGDTSSPLLGSGEDEDEDGSGRLYMSVHNLLFEDNLAAIAHVDEPRGKLSFKRKRDSDIDDDDGYGGYHDDDKDYDANGDGDGGGDKGW
ncbi:hypothetical protein N3K66_003908 [Trichothecium roseum]|uniref:Uncharacterized protein n=1 Tax=Trichothecium roseum TaxID=47278 RepID=A0ACC0V870_9HYPO|nr:hypothetical protein N3K66_003908 [Trichothecium roseum]